jgi:hypothetical protein
LFNEKSATILPQARKNILSKSKSLYGNAKAKISNASLKVKSIDKDSIS